jgi:hypothetical protein
LTGPTPVDTVRQLTMRDSMRKHPGGTLATAVKVCAWAALQLACVIRPARGEPSTVELLPPAVDSEAAAAAVQPEAELATPAKSVTIVPLNGDEEPFTIEGGGSELVDGVPMGPLDVETDGADTIDMAPLLVETLGYNTTIDRIAWLIGDDDSFGVTSLEWLPTLPGDRTRGVVTGFGVHFLDGPVRTDMPPRLFDFALGYQWRQRINPTFAIDAAFRVGAFADFETSARKGVRYPSHVVAYGRLAPAWELALGIDYLDRDDISLLPVAGLLWRPNSFVKLDALFPRPRLAIRLPDGNEWVYVRGELGGGTWAIERADRSRDNATYSDLRLALGVESFNAEGRATSFEVAYVFDRELSYRSGIGDFQPGDLVMLGFNTTF